MKTYQETVADAVLKMSQNVVDNRRIRVQYLFSFMGQTACAPTIHSLETAYQPVLMGRVKCSQPVICVDREGHILELFA